MNSVHCLCRVNNASRNDNNSEIDNSGDTLESTYRRRNRGCSNYSIALRYKKKKKKLSMTNEENEMKAKKEKLNIYRKRIGERYITRIQTHAH